MSSNPIRILKGCVATPEFPEPRLNYFAYVFDMSRGMITATHVVAGGENQLGGRRNLTEPFHEFEAWVQEVRYYAKLDVNQTNDLERFVKKMGSDPDFVEKMVGAISANNFQRIEFDFTAGLEHILGTKGLKSEFITQQMTQAPAKPKETAPAAEAPPPGIPMSFIMAPISGVVLPRLPIGEQVMVRFKNLKDGRTQAYLQRNPPEEDAKNPDQLMAVLRELHEAPSFGPDAVKAVVELPGGDLGEVIEESRSIRVKTAAVSGKSGRSSSGSGYVNPNQDKMETSHVVLFGLGITAILGIAGGLLIAFLS